MFTTEGYIGDLDHSLHFEGATDLFTHVPVSTVLPAITVLVWGFVMKGASTARFGKPAHVLDCSLC